MDKFLNKEFETALSQMVVEEDFNFLNKPIIGHENLSVNINGIESLYGDIKIMIGNVEVDSNGIYINGEKTEFTPLFESGFISETQNGETLFPKSVTGSENTFYSDYYEVGENPGVGRKVLCVGGSYNSEGKAGVFYSDISVGLDEAKEDVGTRIVFKKKIN